jgi:hypothetical protein
MHLYTQLLGYYRIFLAHLTRPLPCPGRRYNYKYYRRA